ncbi:MAG: sugar phosphate isomerase/epimerase family protein [Eubacteriales bacterium]|jgi:sugar phosphate isomerase/epimerase
MSKAKIGVISMMLNKKIAEIGIYETLRQYADIGFRCLEVSQLEMNSDNIAELKKACKDFGIKIPVISAALEPMFPNNPNMPARPSYSLETDFEKIVSDCKELGSTVVRIGSLPLTYSVCGEKYIEFAQKCERAAEKLAQHGIRLYYHNHNWEFAKFNGKHGLDLIRENTSKLGFELDVHWAWRGGVDPAKLIKEYAGRVDLIHLKDYRIGAPDPEILKESDIRKIFGALMDSVQFAEIGEGTLDFAAIIEAGLESGAEYFFIEQDDTYGRDVMESLKISAQNIRALGYGELIK